MSGSDTLAITLNGAAHEVARLEGLRAAALSLWIAAVVDEPLAGKGRATDRLSAHRRDLDAMWQTWHAVLDGLVTLVETEEGARAALERRYFDGRSILFGDAIAAWVDLRDIVDRLVGLAELLGATGRQSAGGWSERRADVRSGADHAQARATILADDARVKAFELLGDRPRAVAIMERRLRTEAEWRPPTALARSRTL